MSWITVIWSASSGACLMLALMHLVVWIRDRHSWANLCFFITVLGVIGMTVGEMANMHAESPASFGRAIRGIHLAYAVVVVASLGFVHFYFGTGRPWLLAVALGLRLAALLANYTTGMNLHLRAIHSLDKVSFLGEQVSVLGEWEANPWVRLGQFASLVQLAYVVDASLRLWRTGPQEMRKRALLVGGLLSLFVLVGVGLAGLIAAGAVRMPAIVSFPFLGVLLAMGYELSRGVLSAARLSRDLQSSEGRLREATSTARLALWEWDVGTDRVWFSSGGRLLYGMTLDEDVDLKRFVSALHPDDRQIVRLAVDQAVTGSGPHTTVYRVVLPDGEVRWIAASGHVERDAQGRATLLRGVSMDITERKRSEEALRESEARFRAVANTAPVMIWMSGTDKLCNFFNKGWLDFTGRTVEEELGNGWAEGVHPDDFERCLKIYTNSFDARQEFTMQYRLRKHDGTYGWLLDQGVPRIAADGAFLGYIGSCVDITLQKQEDERFRLVVEASPSAMVMVNSEGKIALVNAQAEAVFGYTREELMGQCIEVLVPERSRHRHPGDRLSYFAGATLRIAGPGRELLGQRKDGSEVPIEIGLSRIPTPEGMFVLASIVDISARKQAEQEAARHRQELAHLSRVSMLGEMSNSLAHELHQPLGAILNNAQAGERFLGRGVQAGDNLGAIFKDIADDAKRARGVINGLRAMLKKGDGVEPQPMDVNESVTKSLQLMHSEMVVRKVRVDLLLEESLPPALAERVGVQQVLINLILNSLDALQSLQLPDRAVAIATSAKENFVVVTVRDTGPGISPEMLSCLFEPFTSTKPNGLGLGLTISQRMVAQFGGELLAENHPAGGAVFRMSLPIAGRPNEGLPPERL